MSSSSGVIACLDRSIGSKAMWPVRESMLNAILEVARADRPPATLRPYAHSIAVRVTHVFPLVMISIASHPSPLPSSLSPLTAHLL